MKHIFHIFICLLPDYFLLIFTSINIILSDQNDRKYNIINRKFKFFFYKYRIYFQLHSMKMIIFHLRPSLFQVVYKQHYTICIINVLEKLLNFCMHLEYIENKLLKLSLFIIQRTKAFLQNLKKISFTFYKIEINIFYIIIIQLFTFKRFSV